MQKRLKWNIFNIHKTVIFVSINFITKLDMATQEKRSIATYTKREKSSKQTSVTKHVTSSKAEAAKFLKRAGIITERGVISDQYKRSE